MAAPGTSKAVFEATGDALSSTIGEVFDIPLYAPEDQIAGVPNEAVFPSQTNQLAPQNSNAHEKDDAGDQALIDLVPVPSDIQTSSSPLDEPWDPLKGILGD